MVEALSAIMRLLSAKCCHLFTFKMLKVSKKFDSIILPAIR